MSSVSIRCRVLLLTAVVGVVTLAGCGDPPPEQSAAASGAAKPVTTPKGAVLGSHMVSAVSANKNSTSVSVHFSLGSAPTVGKPLPVEIAIVPHEKFESVLAHFESRDGLAIPVGDKFGPTDDVDVEKPFSHQLVLLPAKEGMFTVTVAVETTGESGNIVRIFSIPVIVAAANAAAADAPAPAEPAKQ
jgi:hypothetical protein